MSIKKLHLHALTEQSYVPSPRVSECYAEAASVCLENQNHKKGVTIKVVGALETAIQLEWEEVTQQMRDNWADLTEATEDGATCLAILLIQTLTDYKVIQRSPKKTGVDYWLGDKDAKYPFQKKARLEVSGLLKGTTAQINYRVKEKMEQTKRSDALKIPAYIVIVEFSTPICKIAIRYE